VEGVQGQDLLLPCLVEGFPQPLVLWTKDTGHGFSSSPSLSLSSMKFDNGTLFVASAGKEAEGQYTCSADNGVRAAISKTINVTINGELGGRKREAL